jgi:hypothetical protein
MFVDGIWCYVLYVIHSENYVGCTSDFEQRCFTHKRKRGDHIIIEILDTWPISVGARFAGDREWEWADTFNYPRGQHYSNTWSSKLSSEDRSRAGKIGGHRGSKSQLARGTHSSQTGKTPFHTGAAGKAGIVSQLTSGTHISQRPDINMFFTGNAQKVSVASPNHINKQIFTCPYCGQSGKGPRMKRHTTDLNCWLLKTFAANNAAIEDHL